MSDNSLHHAAIPGDVDSDEFSSGRFSEFTSEFAQVTRETDLSYELHGYIAGPLEATTDAIDRHDMRINQARALVSMLKEEESRAVFASLKNSTQSYYLQAIEQLLDAAYIDGKLAFKQAMGRV